MIVDRVDMLQARNKCTDELLHLFSLAMLDAKRSETKLGTLSKRLRFLGSARRKYTVFASDDEDVPEQVYHDDKPELEMIGVADESKVQLRRVQSELEARKLRLRKVTSAAQDIATNKKFLRKGGQYEVRNPDMDNGTPVILK